jgi:hypothetical protein
MPKIKTFACPLKIFQTKQELENLDKTVNDFLTENNVDKVYSVSDASVTDNSGAAIGLIRVVAYD